jgi:hypothetical protein
MNKATEMILFMKEATGKSLFKNKAMEMITKTTFLFWEMFRFSKSYRWSIPSETDGSLGRNLFLVLTVFYTSRPAIRRMERKAQNAVSMSRFQCRYSSRLWSGFCSHDSQIDRSLLKLAMVRTHCSEAATRLLQFGNKLFGWWNQ